VFSQVENVRVEAEKVEIDCLEADRNANKATDHPKSNFDYWSTVFPLAIMPTISLPVDVRLPTRAHSFQGAEEEQACMNSPSVCRIL
jgi:hypothetical protein